MAVVQVSTIQVRQGYLQELGQLAAGEFGWANDKLRLFIGNGTVQQGAPFPGNTEILTEYSDLTKFFQLYTFRGTNSGYQVVTGFDELNPIIRKFQDKFDDIVNIKDFGGRGNGINDDTAAIQRAIDQIYNKLSGYVDESTRRVIEFYPGIYIINGELRIPPYCVFRGRGQGSVIIRHTGVSSTLVFKTTNSAGNADALIATNGESPGPIEFCDIQFESIYNIPIFHLESVKNALFRRCKFIGPVTNFNSDTGVAGVRILSSYLKTRNIRFIDCDFSNFSTAVSIRENLGTSDVQFHRCTFSQLYKGIRANTVFGGNTISGIKITNSVFDAIATEAIRTESNVRGVVSSVNTFLSNIGRRFGANVTDSVIVFGGNISYSWSDVFERADLTTIPTVEHNTDQIVSIDTETGLRLGNTYITLGRSIIAQNNSTNYIPIQPKFRHGVIHYNINRGSLTKTGQIQYVSDPTANVCNWRDSSTERISTGVNIQVEWSAANARPSMVCTVDSSGDPCVVSYDIKSIYSNPLI